jgi:hypothetical protein
MSRARSVLLFAMLGATGCYLHYEPPTLAEPHATIKTRVVYHAVSGPQLAQHVLVNDHVADVPNPVTLPGEVSRAVLVRPEGMRFDVRTTFFHTASIPQTVTESYTCGMIGNVPQTCTRVVTKMVTIQVTDGACAQAAGLGPQPDAVYLMQYDYFGPNRCSLACFREQPQPDGSFRNAPCDPPPPPPAAPR